MDFMRDSSSGAGLLDGEQSKTTSRTSCQNFIGKWISYAIPVAMLLASIIGVIVVLVSPPSSSPLVSVASKASLSVNHDALHALNCSAGDSASACVTKQITTLKEAIQEGFANIDSWRTWAAQRSNLKMPTYGSWRMVQHVETNNTHDKWIVITSIAPPTEQIKAWAALKDWKVVVVGDTKSPKVWHLDGVVFLSVADQEAMPFQFVKQVPHKNYARKAIGYLYALQNGAKVIYESDDDNAPKPELGLKWIRPSSVSDAVLTQGKGTAINPYSFFGQCTIWPRGYPLNDLLQHGANYCYPVKEHVTTPAPSSPEVSVPIQQGLADLDPDVDAIWRLARPADIGKIKFAEGSGLAFSRGTFSPYNTQNTVHYETAFWALFIPSGVNMRVCDIWRSYWAQRLLWEMGSSVMFVSGTVDQVRNAHDYVKDFKDEMQMYVQVPHLIDFLQNWRCQHSHMYDCMLQLGYDMAVNDFWSPQDLQLLTAWVHDLAALGYQPPALKSPPRTPEAQMHFQNVQNAKQMEVTIPWITDEQSAHRMRLYQRSRQSCAQRTTDMGNIYLGDEQRLERMGKVYEMPTDSSGPYLSIMLTTNNQDTTGQHLRLSHFIKNMAAYTAKYKLHEALELIIVDYNSNPALPALWEAPTLVLPNVTDLPLVRFITITHAMHKLITHKVKAFSDPGFWEYLGKNIAMRRACGQYQLVTNPDAWLSEGFWQMVEARAFKPSMYYRMGRIETKAMPEGSLTWPIEQVRDFLGQHGGGICGPYSRQDSGGNWVHGKFDNLPAWLETPFNKSATNNRGKIAVIGCPGDFVLMHRDAISTMRGYPEVPIPTALDDVLIVAAVHLGLECGIPPAPAVMFHLWHTKSYSKSYSLSWQHVDLKLKSTFFNGSADVATANKQKLTLWNDNSWGLAHHDLPEYYI